MAGTTTNYAFPYPTSTDLVRNGASAIQSLADSIDSYISGSLALNKLVNYADSLNTTAGTTTATTPTAIGGGAANSTSVQLGKSGVALVLIQAQMSNSAAANTSFISPDITGASTLASSANRAGAVPGTVKGSASWFGILDGTPSGTLSVAAHAWGSAAGTTTIHWSRITIITLG